MIEMGSQVTWTSSSSGTTKEKTGIVLSFLPNEEKSTPEKTYHLAQDSVKQMAASLPTKEMPDLVYKTNFLLSRLDSVISSSWGGRIDRYLVWVPEMDKFYTPRASMVDNQNRIKPEE